MRPLPSLSPFIENDLEKSTRDLKNVTCQVPFYVVFRSIVTKLLKFIKVGLEITTTFNGTQVLKISHVKCRTADPDRQNLARSSKLSFFTIYKFWQNCASVRQVSDLILKTGSLMINRNQHAFHIKDLVNLVQKYWSCLGFQKLTN